MLGLSSAPTPAGARDIGAQNFSALTSMISGNLSMMKMLRPDLQPSQILKPAAFRIFGSVTTF